MKSYYSEFADQYREAWAESLHKINDAIRSGNYETAQGAALVAVLDYPSNLALIGYDLEECRKADKCKYAYSVLEVLYRRAFVVLTHIANQRGLNVAALKAGQTTLKEIYSPALYGNGTLYGLDLPKNASWTECMTGKDWDKLPAQTRIDLVSFRDELEKEAAPEKEATEIQPGKQEKPSRKNRNQVKAGKQRAVIDEEDQKEILNQWDKLKHIKINTDRANRVITLCKQNIERKDGKQITTRNITDLVKRSKPKTTD